MRKPLLALLGLFSSTHLAAATFVYVSNAEDGDIGMYTLRPTARCSPGSASRRTRW